MKTYNKNVLLIRITMTFWILNMCHLNEFFFFDVNWMLKPLLYLPEYIWIYQMMNRCNYLLENENEIK